ncbi:MMPL family transporter, partial [bacterium]|nr:MMPL family transporter [bacterium]
TLGMAIDFAIHFMARSREMVNAHGSWQKAIPFVFGEPARAISRNLVVIAVGFLPLLAAPLVPYKTVGIFIATILAVSGVGTLVLLPSLVTVMNKWLYKPGAEKGFTCNCAVCIVSSILAVLLLALNLGEFLDVGWTSLTWISLILIPVFASICGMLSRRGVCKIEDEPKETIAEEE